MYCVWKNSGANVIGAIWIPSVAADKSSSDSIYSTNKLIMKGDLNLNSQ